MSTTATTSQRCGWWLCGHAVSAHTTTRGCTERPEGHQCLCYFTAREAAKPGTTWPVRRTA